jgi:glutamine---fructose-6-phosphate transaminase (isomerizing)
MCGIVGILGTGDVAPRILEALRRLEYRGYDSAGIAVLRNGEIARTRAPGKLDRLAKRLDQEPLPGPTGIGHTRWATHGVPNETNAHPHVAGGVAIVHNGIIENFRELKDELIVKGKNFSSQTDTEVVAHLINDAIADGQSPREAVHAVLGRLKGAFAFVILFQGEQDLMMGARRGSPLAVGHGDGEMFLGSDSMALAPFTNRVTYLDEGDWVVLTRGSCEIYDSASQPVARSMNFTQASSLLVDKGNHRHFMAKEIFEQPEVIGHTLAEYVDFGERVVAIRDTPGLDLSRLDRLTITACGTGFYAALTAKYWFERLARIPTEVDIASEFR